MPYKNISELSDPIKHVLPKDAQKIFLVVFNNAWEEYKSKSNYEEIAFKVAWHAVKEKYEKKDGQWEKK